MRRRGYAGVTVRESLATLPVHEPDTLIFYSADGVVASSPSNGLPSRATTRRAGPYHQRVWRLFQSLEERGARPALCAALPDDRGGYAVHPCLPATRSTLTHVTLDDVLARRDAAPHNGNAAAVVVLVPDSGLGGALDAGRATLPRVGRDLAALVPEVALRVAYRLTPEKHLF